MSVMQDGGYVVAVGNAFDGLTLFGPFDNPDDASEWADSEFHGESWEVVDLEETA